VEKDEEKDNGPENSERGEQKPSTPSGKNRGEEKEALLGISDAHRLNS